jgi:hypothetical protein
MVHAAILAKVGRPCLQNKQTKNTKELKVEWYSVRECLPGMFEALGSILVQQKLKKNLKTTTEPQNFFMY